MIRRMLSNGLMAAMVLMLFSGFSIAAEKVKFGIVAEFSGPGSAVAMRWERGVMMAVEEINGAGGLLGREIETFSLDTKTQAPVSVAVMKKAVEMKPFVIMGTLFSSSTIVNMKVLQEAGVPQFTGSEAPSISKQGNPNIFMTSYSSDRALQKVVKWLSEVLKVKNLAIIYANTEFGRGGRDALVGLLKPKGVAIVTDIATEMEQTDFTGELSRVQRSAADTLFLFQHEDANGRILPQIKEVGLDKKMRIVGHTTLLTEDVIMLAKEAANGIMGHVGLSPVAEPLRPLTEKYEKKYQELPDHNFYKGYLGVQTVRAIVEEIGAFDQQKLRDMLHNRTLCVKKYPYLRMDLAYDDKGNIDRESFLVKVENQKHVITGTLAPLREDLFEKCK